MRHPLAATFLPLLLISACATAPPKGVESVALGAPGSAYGLFLAGSSALGDGRNSEALRLLELAKAQGGSCSIIIDDAPHCATGRTLPRLSHALFNSCFDCIIELASTACK
jgi:hypothetical protein